MLANEVYMPAAFSETDVFDALNESLDRLSRIEGPEVHRSDCHRH